MIRPSKHSHPDRTVINVSLLVLGFLKKRRVDKFDNLRRDVKRAVSGGDVLLLPALNFLFLLGIIDYRPKIDSVEYVAPNERF
jgi:hypothetical protein